jgi:hypothetical protein
MRTDAEPWEQRLRGFGENRFWYEPWGPPPDSDRCRAPAELLRRCGYATKPETAPPPRFAVSPQREPL